MAPKRVEDSTDELVEEIPQDLETTEVQVPRLVQLPRTATGPLTASANRMGFSTLGLSKADGDFNFRLAGMQP